MLLIGVRTLVSKNFSKTCNSSDFHCPVFSGVTFSCKVWLVLGLRATLHFSASVLNIITPGSLEFINCSCTKRRITFSESFMKLPENTHIHSEDSSGQSVVHPKRNVTFLWPVRIQVKMPWEWTLDLASFPTTKWTPMKQRSTHCLSHPKASFMTRSVIVNW